MEGPRGLEGRQRPMSGRPGATAPRVSGPPRPTSARGTARGSVGVTRVSTGPRATCLGTSPEDAEEALWVPAASLSCERISEVDEEEDTSSSRPSSTPSSVPSSAGGAASSSSVRSLSLAVDEDAEEDSTLADLSAVSSLSEGTAPARAEDDGHVWDDPSDNDLVPDEEQDEDLAARPERYLTTGLGAGDEDSWLEAVAIGCVLEDAVNQLSILAHTSRAAKLAPNLAQRTLDERLQAIDAREAASREHIVPPAYLTEENARVDKIQKDRALVQEALRLQLVWLRVPAGPLQDSPLCRLVRDEEQRAAEEAAMLVDSARRAGRADTLRGEVLVEALDARRQLRAIKEERAQLQEEARSLRARTALGAAITERWERSRLQQHQRHLRGQEDDLQRRLQRQHEDHRLELRAHCELVEYLQQATQSLETQSEEWQERYDEVTAAWDKKLSALKAERQEHMKQLRAVRKELARRERFKREFLAYKAERDRQIEERLRANQAATRIQCWWRMTMVRKGLGPYKRIAKKKKKKKK